jgi:uncharacterized LabA/DUF88 family protein
MANDKPPVTAKLASLIDGDNISASFMPLIMREAAKHGTVAIRRIYGQFKSGKMKSWMKHVDDFDLTAVNVSPLTHGKNATDMKLTIEAMDMMHGRQLDGICIASSDGDFTPLAARIRASAFAVYGFGAKKAPKGYKDEFDRFYECDTLMAAERAAAGKANQPAARRRISAKKPPPDDTAGKRPAPTSRPSATRALVTDEMLLAAIDAAAGKDGWAHLANVGKKLHSQHPDFETRYGRPKLKPRLAKMTGIESKIEDGVDWVRREPA